MIFRQGTETEMLKLWYRTYTSEFFSENIQKGNAEFWTIDNDGNLIGELYIFKKLDNNDIADGYTTAYLCAFRIIKNMQGKGLGTELMECVFDRLRELNFSYVTIGVEPKEEANIRLYKRMGFTEKLKVLYEDPCGVDEFFLPVKCSECILLRKKL